MGRAIDNSKMQRSGGPGVGCSRSLAVLLTLDLPNLLTLNTMKPTFFPLLGACLFLGLAPLAAQGQCAEGESEVVVEILTDNYPGEITWTLTGLGGELLSGGPYGSSGTVYADTVCIASEEEFPCLQFVINDSYGDGICCGYGQGAYTVYLDSVAAVSYTHLTLPTILRV